MVVLILFKSAIVSDILSECRSYDGGGNGVIRSVGDICGDGVDAGVW